jgi:hypothetical protein
MNILENYWPSLGQTQWPSRHLRQGKRNNPR